MGKFLIGWAAKGLGPGGRLWAALIQNCRNQDLSPGGWIARRARGQRKNRQFFLPHPPPLAAPSPQGEGLNISEPHNLPTFGIPGELDGFAGERRSKGAGRGRPRGAQAKADFAQKNGAPGELGGSLGRGGARERGEGDQGEPKQKRTLRKKNGAPANLGVRWGEEEQGSGARATKGSPSKSGLCDDVGQNCNKTGTKMGQNRDESSLLSWYSGSISPPWAETERNFFRKSTCFLYSDG